MSRAVKNSEQDLRTLGVKLQDLIMQSRARLPKIKGRDKSLRMARSISNAEYVFNTISATIMTTQRVENFMQDKFGVGIGTVLKAAGHDPDTMKNSSLNAMVVLNKSIALVIQDLTSANAEADKDTHHETKK